MSLLSRAMERVALAGLRSMDPERAHEMSLEALRRGWRLGGGPVESARLRVDLAGLALPNPVGLAAGYDKNAVAIGQLARAGFGFIEVGAATPRPQPGNPRPRMFRLPEQGAVINRFGFNNDGMKAICERMRDARAPVPVGLNIGANKDSADRAADYAAVMREAKGAAEFVTINVSSPNTAALRDLQGAAALRALLETALAERHCPVLLKIAPDLETDEIEQIAEIALSMGLDGIVATNTTVSREGLTGPHEAEAGGLSGRPLFEMSTRVLARLAKATEGRIPLIGVGGVASAGDAWEKIRAGASAVQLYTALGYAGFGLVRDIATGLDDRLARERLSMPEAVGRGVDAWL